MVVPEKKQETLSRLNGVVVFDVMRARELRDDAGIALPQIPKVVDVAIAQDHETGVLRPRIFAGLFLCGERVFGFLKITSKSFAIGQLDDLAFPTP